MDRRKEPDGRQPGARRQRGFTLIELIAVIIIMGVLSAIIYSSAKLGDPSLQSRTSELRSQLRFVQLRAMKSGMGYVGMKCDGTNYWAFTGTDPSNTSLYVALPGETGVQVPLAGKSMTLNAFTVYFDSFGIPYSDTPSPLTKLAAAQSLSITIGGQSATLSLTPETGFIP